MFSDQDDLSVGLVTADRGVVAVSPPSWRAELAVEAEDADAVAQRFEALLGRHARQFAGQQWCFSREDPLGLAGAPGRRLSAGQRVFLAVVRVCALQRHAGSWEFVLDDSVLEVLDHQHRAAARGMMGR